VNKETVVDNLAKTNKSEYNYLKLIEELAELNEVLIKTLTKGKAHKPPISKIIEESAHVIFRTNVLIEMLDIRKEVKVEYQTKADYLHDFYEKNMYIGGL